MKKDLSHRFGLIDTLRGFWLLNMIAFHLCYDIFVIYGYDSMWYAHTGVVIWERCICVSFILLSGISLHFSRHPFRRGIIINLAGFLITTVTFFAMPSQVVWFGVLNLIGTAMIITAALRFLLDRINPYLGAALSLLFFAVFYGVPHHYIGFFGWNLRMLPDFLYQFRYAAFLGFPSAGFHSSDYFPLIAWIFLFVLGYFLWSIVQRLHKEEWFRRGFAPLSFLGRHSLLIYLLHQPVLMGACVLFFDVLKLSLPIN